MNTCPNCGNGLPEGDVLCTHCGHVAPPAVEVSAATALVATRRTATPMDVTPPRRPMQRLIVAAVVTTLVAAGMVFAALGIRSRPAAASQEPHVPPTGQVTAAPPIRTAGAPPVVSGPKWMRSRQSGWATDGPRTVTFELKAEQEVPVWMRKVVPRLALGCL